MNASTLHFSAATVPLAAFSKVADSVFFLAQRCIQWEWERKEVKMVEADGMGMALRVAIKGHNT
jgi:hypothetical protein